ncbi:MAG: GNAT family N-acetyltransferase [Spirochaetaceae bacterium]|nr:GNAT family N-acetyltransferase [Spirochaetaceae bacterium]
MDKFTNPLQGERLYLRAYKEEDTQPAYKLINDYSSIRTARVLPTFPTSLQEEKDFVGEAMKKSGPTFDFAIVRNEDDVYMGGCSVQKFDEIARIANIGIFLGKPYQRLGYGYEALSLLIRFIFNELNIRKIKLFVFSFNEAGIALYKKLGFKEEGVLKEELYREGRYHDSIVMGLFRRDWVKN